MDHVCADLDQHYPEFGPARSPQHSVGGTETRLWTHPTVAIRGLVLLVRAAGRTFVAPPGAYHPLRPRFQHEIERRLRRAAKSCESAAADHNFPQARFAGLGAKRRASSRQRYGHAYLRRRAVHDASHRIEIILLLIVGIW